MNTFGVNNPLTNLVPSLQDVDPDEAFSSVPYEKGFALLYHLEELMEGPGKTWTHQSPSDLELYLLHWSDVWFLLNRGVHGLCEGLHPTVCIQQRHD